MAVAFLRVLRVFCIVAGLGLSGLGVVMLAAFGGTGTTGGHVVATWWCEPDGDRVDCQTTDADYAGPRGVIDGVTWLGCAVGGVALIGAAVALGQFDRPRPPAGAPYQAASIGGSRPVGRQSGPW